ncbi:MAG TPA: peptidoglycan DD-metalloendopeptidase family protein [Geobacteraceae bacterium]
MMQLCFAIIALLLLVPDIGRADVKDELQGVKKEINEKKLLIKKTTKVENKVSDEIQQIDKSLRDKEMSLAALGKQLDSVETGLSKTRGEIEATRTEVERRKKQIAERLATLYKAGEVSNARMFFSSESFPEMVENLRYTQSILENDRRTVAEYNARIERLRELKASLEQDLARKEKIKSNIEVKKQEVAEEKKKKAAYLVKIRQDKSHYISSLKELEANARRLQVMVERLEARSRKSYTRKSDAKSVGGGPSLPPLSDKGFGGQRGRLALPARGEIVTRFGRHKHPEFNSFTVSNGIAIAASAGSDIRSVFDGQVIFADYFKGYGNMVIVDHGGGYFSLYAHAAKILKKVGASVHRNDVVASVGDVDSPRGAQLYFEIRYQGKPVDPAPWFR